MIAQNTTMFVDSEGGLRVGHRKIGYRLTPNLPPLKKVIRLGIRLIGLTQMGTIILLNSRMIDDNDRNIRYTIIEPDSIIDTFAMGDIIDIINVNSDLMILLADGRLYQGEVIANNITKLKLIQSNVSLIASDRMSDSLLLVIGREWYQWTNDYSLIPLGMKDFDKTIISCQIGVVITSDGSDNGSAYHHSHNKMKRVNIPGKIIDGIEVALYIIYLVTNDGIIHKYDTRTDTSIIIQHSLFKYIQFRRFIGKMDYHDILFEDIKGDLYTIDINGRIGSLNLSFKIYGYRI